MPSAVRPSIDRGRRFERAFAAWGRLILRRPRLAIVLPLLLAAALSSQAPKAAIDNDDGKLLLPGDPSMLRYAEFQREFGRDDAILVALQPPDVFDESFLETLRALHRDLERDVPHVREVRSLLNARVVRGAGDRLIVENLLDDWPETDAERAALRQRVLANPLYRNVLISEDARFTLISIVLERVSSGKREMRALEGFEEIDPATLEKEPPYRYDAATEAGVQAIREITERHATADVGIHVTGGPVIAQQLNEISRRDMALFLAMSMLGVMILLGVLFRRVAAVLLPVAVVLASIGSTIGCMALTGTPISVITQIVPSFLFVVGVCDSIHILTLVYQRTSQGDTKEAAIVAALSHSGMAILLTSLTTAAGLASFVTAEVQPMVDLGIFAPLGVAFAFLYTVTLLPAALALLPIKAPPNDRRSEHPRLDRLLAACGALSTGHPRKVLAASAVILCIALAGALQLRISFDSLAWFPERDPLRIATHTIDRELKGSMALEVMLHTERDDGLHDPELLQNLDSLAQRVSGFRTGELFVGKASSVSDIVKEIHQALHEGDPSFHVIPTERAVVAQELLLFEQAGAEHLARVTDGPLSMARTTLRVPRVDATLYLDLIDAIEEASQELLGRFGKVHSTGALSLLGRITEATAVSMVRSYAIALLVITPLMMVVMGSVGRGLLSMLPNVAPIVVCLGLMRVLQIPLDMTTVLLGSVVLGIAVDDTIHFMHRFNRSYAESGDPHGAVQQTLATTGVALLFTSLVLAAGFFILMLGYMVNVSNFGLLLGLATLTAFVADILMAPALMTLISPHVSRSW